MPLRMYSRARAGSTVQDLGRFASGWTRGYVRERPTPPHGPNPETRTLRIVFFGTGDFAIPSLKALKESGLSPELVVTKPDAPRGRGRKIYDAEVKLAANDLELPCAQPADPHAP